MAVNALAAAKLVRLAAGQTFQTTDEMADMVDVVTGLPLLLEIVSLLDGSETKALQAIEKAAEYRKSFP